MKPCVGRYCLRTGLTKQVVSRTEAGAGCDVQKIKETCSRSGATRLTRLAVSDDKILRNDVDVKTAGLRREALLRTAG